MTTESLVQRSIKGDVDAFTDLVTRYQGMAFAYALTTLRDYQLAEDATQQALITAWRNLASLRDPGRFGSWLRGIVRFECLRLLRAHARQQSTSLEDIDVIDPAIDIEQQAEVRGEVQRVLGHIARLPERQRVVAQLYYLGDQPQAVVAEFLGLSISTVNNRLREARAILRQEGAYPMSTQHLDTPEFSKTIGNVIRARELIIDARIDNESRPPLLTAVQIGDADRAITAFISQYLDDDVARLIAIDERGGRANVPSGASVHSQGHLTEVLASAHTIDQLVNASRVAAQPAVIPTGIKVIDLFAPLVQGGVVALVGAMNVGKLVVVEELAARLGRTGQRVTILVLLASPDELGVAHQLNMRVEGMVTSMLIPVADASPEALSSSLDRVDTVVAMSHEMGRDGFYPAIDPLVSRSHAVDISPVAVCAHQLLSTQPGDRRSRLLRDYLTQPFFVAEDYTGRPGITVDPEIAAADIARILDGEMTGSESDDADTTRE
ncbi:MAG: sigma-70 family RNA polymerase sigma factor [Thermomicrobiales bacterium]|nr:sigma-70 family RNA polymerase sigma factor [Thermomicrobiales bacterium]